MPENTKKESKVGEDIIMEEKTIEKVEEKIEIPEESGNEVGIERILLKEMLEVSRKYINGEIGDNELNDFGRRMVIRSYIPIREKIGIMMKIVTTAQYSPVNSQEIKVGELYQNLFFDLLLGGYAMIDCSNKDLVSFDNYDILYPIFSTFILNVCGQDYKMAEDMVLKTIDMYNIVDLNNIMSSISDESINEAMQSNKELVKSLEDNKKMVSDLKEISYMNNPDAKKILDAAKKRAVEEIMENKREEN